jgi:hypothetical protein
MAQGLFANATAEHSASVRPWDNDISVADAHGKSFCASPGRQSDKKQQK